jgi:hypothetical protein
MLFKNTSQIKDLRYRFRNHGQSGFCLLLFMLVAVTRANILYVRSVQYWRAWEATLSGDRIRRRLLYCSKASTHTENIHTTKLRRHRLLCQFKVYARRPSTLSGVVANGQVRSGLGELIAGLNKPRNLDK